MPRLMNLFYNDRNRRKNLKVVLKLAVTTFVDVDLGDSVLLIQLFVVVHFVDVEINMVGFETPALIYE